MDARARLDELKDPRATCTVSCSWSSPGVSGLPCSGPSSTVRTTARPRPGSRCLAHCPVSTLQLPVTDREFVGTECVKFLNNGIIKFAIRLHEDRFAKGETQFDRVTIEDGCDLTLFAWRTTLMLDLSWKQHATCQEKVSAIGLLFAILGAVG